MASPPLSDSASARSSPASAMRSSSKAALPDQTLPLRQAVDPEAAAHAAVLRSSPAAAAHSRTTMPDQATSRRPAGAIAEEAGVLDLAAGTGSFHAAAGQTQTGRALPDQSMLPLQATAGPKEATPALDAQGSAGEFAIGAVEAAGILASGTAARHSAMGSHQALAAVSAEADKAGGRQTCSVGQEAEPLQETYATAASHGSAPAMPNQDHMSFARQQLAETAVEEQSEVAPDQDIHQSRIPAKEPELESSAALQQGGAPAADTTPGFAHIQDSSKLKTPADPSAFVDHAAAEEERPRLRTVMSQHSQLEMSIGESQDRHTEGSGTSQQVQLESDCRSQDKLPEGSEAGQQLQLEAAFTDSQDLQQDGPATSQQMQLQSASADSQNKQWTAPGARYDSQLESAAVRQGVISNACQRLQLESTADGSEAREQSHLESAVAKAVAENQAAMGSPVADLQHAVDAAVQQNQSALQERSHLMTAAMPASTLLKQGSGTESAAEAAQHDRDTAHAVWTAQPGRAMDSAAAVMHLGSESQSAADTSLHIAASLSGTVAKAGELLQVEDLGALQQSGDALQHGKGFAGRKRDILPGLQTMHLLQPDQATASEPPLRHLLEVETAAAAALRAALQLSSGKHHYLPESPSKQQMQALEAGACVPLHAYLPTAVTTEGSTAPAVQLSNEKHRFVPESPKRQQLHSLEASTSSLPHNYMPAAVSASSGAAMAVQPSDHKHGFLPDSPTKQPLQLREASDFVPHTYLPEVVASSAAASTVCERLSSPKRLSSDREEHLYRPAPLGHDSVAKPGAATAVAMFAASAAPRGDAKSDAAEAAKIGASMLIAKSGASAAAADSGAKSAAEDARSGAFSGLAEAKAASASDGELGPQVPQVGGKAGTAMAMADSSAASSANLSAALAASGKLQQRPFTEEAAQQTEADNIGHTVSMESSNAQRASLSTQAEGVDKHSIGANTAAVNDAEAGLPENTGAPLVGGPSMLPAQLLDAGFIAEQPGMLCRQNWISNSPQISLPMQSLPYDLMSWIGMYMPQCMGLQHTSFCLPARNMIEYILSRLFCYGICLLLFPQDLTEVRQP